MHDPEGSWYLYRLMAAFDWQHLPAPGGLLDQNKALMEDLLSIHARRNWLDKELKDGLDSSSAGAYEGYRKRIGSHARLPGPKRTNTVH